MTCAASVSRALWFRCPSPWTGSRPAPGVVARGDARKEREDQEMCELQTANLLAAAVSAGVWEKSNTPDKKGKRVRFSLESQVLKKLFLVEVSDPVPAEILTALLTSISTRLQVSSSRTGRDTQQSRVQ